MKKLTFLGTLILLLFSVSTLRAQGTQNEMVTALGTNIADVSALTDGKRVLLYCTGRNAYVKNDNNNYKMITNVPLNDASNMSFVWTVNIVNGKYTFKDNNGKYIPNLPHGGATTGNTTAGQFSIKKLANGKYIISGTNGQNFNGNAAGGTFTGWNDEGGNSQYEIKVPTISASNKVSITVKCIDARDNNEIKAQTVTWVDPNTQHTIAAAPAIDGYKFVETKVDNQTNTNSSITVSANTVITHSYHYEPFAVSPDLVNNQFAADTKWLRLKMSYGDLTYNSAAQDDIRSTEFGGEDSHLWAFVGDYVNGFKIYNKAAGPGMTFACESPAGNTGKKPRMIATDGQQAANQMNVWKLYKHNAKEFMLSLKGNGVEGHKISIHNSGHYLNFWTGTDANSYIYAINTFDEAAYIKTDLTNAPDGAVHGLSTQQKAELSSCDTKTIEGVQKVYSLFKQRVPFSLENIYLVKTLGRTTNQYLTINSAKATGENLAANNVAQMWKFTDAGAGKRSVSSQGLFLKKPSQSQHISVENALTNNSKLTVAPLDEVSACFIIGGDGRYEKIHLPGDHNNIVGWEAAGEASRWYLIPATTIEVTISDARYATVNYPFAVQLPQDASVNLKAYTGKKGVKGSTNVCFLEEITNGIIPANTPVVLEGDPKAYQLTILANNNTPAIVGNELTGSLLEKEIGTEPTYVLAQPTSKPVGFYKLSDTSRRVKANKAYVQGTAAQAAQINSFVFSIEGQGGNTTGIENEMTDNKENEEYYDLQGRRVMKPSKGIFVTKSGKKVLFF